MATVRITRDLAALTSNPIEGVTFETVGDNIFHVRAKLSGPAGTPYEGGTFVVDVRFASDYPLRSPEYFFVTKIYHPNVVVSTKDGIERGDVCKPKWVPKDTLAKIIEHLCSLLAAPDLDNALSSEIAAQFKANRAEFDRIAADWTRRYASVH
jgi:ubiquitin-conjugating enzyme E2 D/E